MFGKNLKYIFFLTFLLVAISAAGQKTKISGIVTDGETGEEMPLIGVFFEGTSIGANTNLEGKFNLFANPGTYTFKIRYSGYKEYTDTLIVGKEPIENLEIKIFQVSYDLASVLITSKAVNPAIRIVKNAIKHKKFNRMDKIEAYEYDSYNKLVIHMDNLTKKLLSNKLLRKDFKRTVEVAMGDSGLNDTAKYKIAAFISESVSKFYYKKPNEQKEEIYAVKTTGMKGNEFNLLSSFLLHRDIYDNHVKILDRQFLSPVADGAMLTYDFQLISAEAYGRDTLYGIQIIPKTDFSLSFEGKMYIDNKDWAINRVDLKLNGKPNINFVEDMWMRQEYSKIEGFWVPTLYDVEIDFVNHPFKKSGGNFVSFVGRTTSQMSNYKINAPKEDKFYKQELLEIKSGAENKDEAYWEQQRKSPLDKSEEFGMNLVDSLESKGILDWYIDKIDFLVNGTKEFEYVELGPFFYLVGYNRIEGLRFRLGISTLKKFSERIWLGGHIAYGLRDKRIKYLAQGKFKLVEKPRLELGVLSAYEVEQVGFDDFLNEGTSLFESILRRVPLTQLNYYRENKLSLYSDIRKGLAGTFWLRSKQFEPTRIFDFHYRDPVTSEIKTQYSIAEAGMNLRISFKEKYIVAGGEKIYVGTKFPIFNLKYAIGFKDWAFGEFNYHHVSLAMENWLKLGRFGEMEYKLKAGYIHGTLPYSELHVFRGNQTWAWRDVGFNMLDYYEFAADRYVTLMLDHHLQGLLLSKIPGIRELKIKEVLSARMAWGTLTDANKALNSIPANPDPVNGYPAQAIKAPSKFPYVEVGAGLTNILKFIRIDALWRLNYHNLAWKRDPTIRKSNWGPKNNFGVRVHLMIRF